MDFRIATPVPLLLLILLINLPNGNCQTAARYCDNVDLSAFCILDNHFKNLVLNSTGENLGNYYPQFSKIIEDIFDILPWRDDDEDSSNGFIPFVAPSPDDTQPKPPAPRENGVYSLQDMCDLSTVLFVSEGGGPNQFAKNPYHIETTEVTVDGVRLHNHLHFKVFSQASELDGMNKATGKIKYAFIVVHDKHGWAVGDFETGVPCFEDCNCVKKDCRQSDADNTVPCMFTSSYAVTHPGQIMLYDEEGLKEIHATWRFSQSTSPESFTTELHVKTLLLENIDVITKERDCRINFRFTNMYPRLVEERCSSDDDDEEEQEQQPNQPNQPNKPNKPKLCKNVPRTGKFGWTAQYDILWPTLKTLGAWDHFPRGFVRKAVVKCHNPLDPDYYYSEPYPSYELSEEKLAKTTCKFKNRYDIARGGPSLITAALTSLYGKLSWERPETWRLYHGVPANSFFPKAFLHQKNQRPKPLGTPRIEFNQFPNLNDISKDERCRCPRMGTPPPLPYEKAPPVRQLEGRKDHAIQMTIAWIVLVPFAIFSSRYYKETYSKVFFLQEFWWYTIHVLCLVLAAMFMIGGIYAIEIKRDEEFNDEDVNQLVHAIIGGLALLMFAMHLLLGHQRLKRPELRRIQIFFHWLFGILEYFLALFSMLNASFIRAGCMSCANLIFVIGWVIVQIIFYVVMEIHMRKVDKELKLVPKRSYLPPPVMRVFHVSAPGGKFRIIMLVAYFSCCVLSYGIMHYYIEWTRAYRSCFNYDLEFEARIVQFQPN